jgi:hypothetical protein
MEVELREITQDTVRAICSLEVAGDQHGFVAPNAVSIAEAHYAPKHWLRAIYADGEPAGLVLTHEDPAAFASQAKSTAARSSCGWSSGTPPTSGNMRVWVKAPRVPPFRSFLSPGTAGRHHAARCRCALGAQRKIFLKTDV